MRDDFLSVVSLAFVGRILGRGLRYGLTLVVANGLGPAAVGIVAFGLVAMKAGSVLARAGLDNAVQKLLPTFRAADDDAAVFGLVVFSLVVPLVFGSALAVAITGLPRVFDGSFFAILTGPAGVFVIAIPLFATMMVAVAATRAYKRTRYDVLARDLGQSGIAVVLAAVGAFLFDSVFGVAVGYAVSVLLGAVLAILALGRLGAIRADVAPHLDVRRTLSLSIPLMFVAIIQYLLTWTDIFMLTALRTTREVGFYQVAYQTAALLLLFIQAANSVFPAVAAELHEAESRERLATLYTGVTKWVVYLTGLGFAGLVIFSRDVLALFGPSFREVGVVLAVAAAGQFAVAASGPSGFLLSMSGNERLELINNTTVGLLNLGLNYVLIVEYGVLGAAAATAVSLALLNVLRLVEIYHIHGFVPYSRSYLPGTVGVIAGVAVMVPIRVVFAPGLLRVGTAAVASVVAFGAVLSLVGFADEDRILLESLTQR